MRGLLSHIAALHVRHHNYRGVGFNSLTYPFTHNPPVHQNHPVNKHLHPCIHHEFHKPASQLLWPLAKSSQPSPCHRLSSSWLCLSCSHKASWEMESPFTAWSDQPLVTLLPHTFLHMPLKKFLRLPARRSQHFVVLFWCCVWQSLQCYTAKDCKQAKESTFQEAYADQSE